MDNSHGQIMDTGAGSGEKSLDSIFESDKFIKSARKSDLIRQLPSSVCFPLLNALQFGRVTTCGTPYGQTMDMPGRRALTN